MSKNKRRLIRICVCGVGIALEIVLNRFCSINTSAWKIGISFISPVMIAMLYGPIDAAIVYSLSDLLGALLIPIGPYHPGFTVCAAAMGFLYGIALHKRPFVFANDAFIRNDDIDYLHRDYFLRVIPCILINCLIFGLLINTAWVAMLYGSKTYWGWFVYRLPEYAILIPMQMVLIPLLFKIKTILDKNVFKSIRGMI